MTLDKVSEEGVGKTEPEVHRSLPLLPFPFPFPSSSYFRNLATTASSYSYSSLLSYCSPSFSIFYYIPVTLAFILLCALLFAHQDILHITRYETIPHSPLHQGNDDMNSNLFNGNYQYLHVTLLYCYDADGTSFYTEQRQNLYYTIISLIASHNTSSYISSVSASSSISYAYPLHIHIVSNLLDPSFDILLPHILSTSVIQHKVTQYHIGSGQMNGNDDMETNINPNNGTRSNLDDIRDMNICYDHTSLSHLSSLLPTNVLSTMYIPMMYHDRNHGQSTSPSSGGVSLSVEREVYVTRHLYDIWDQMNRHLADNPSVHTLHHTSHNIYIQRLHNGGTSSVTTEEDAVTQVRSSINQNDRKSHVAELDAIDLHSLSLLYSFPINSISHSGSASVWLSDAFVLCSLYVKEPSNYSPSNPCRGYKDIYRALTFQLVNQILPTHPTLDIYQTPFPRILILVADTRFKYIKESDYQYDGSKGYSLGVSFDFFHASVFSNRVYAEKHGYAFRLVRMYDEYAEYVNDRDSVWIKPPIMADYLKRNEYDIIVAIDSDAAFSQSYLSLVDWMSTSVPEFLYNKSILHMVNTDHRCCPGANAGVIIAKRAITAQDVAVQNQMFDLWWNSVDLYEDARRRGWPAEQGVMVGILPTPLRSTHLIPLVTFWQPVRFRL